MVKILITNKKLVSVVVPTFNRSAFITETIKTLVCQTYERIEIIVVDDGSTDDTEFKVKALGVPNLKYVKTENRGVSSAFNRGVIESNGYYIARSDSDDLSKKTRIEYQQGFLSKNNLDVVGSSLSLFGSARGVWSYPLTHNAIQAHAIFSVPVAQPSAFFRAKLFESCSYNEDLNIAEDYEFWTRLISDGYLLGNLDKVLVKYRCHNNQLSNGTSATEILRLYCQRYLTEMYLIPHSEAEIFSKFIHCGLGNNQILKSLVELISPRLDGQAKYIFKRNIMRLILKHNANTERKYSIESKTLELLCATPIERVLINNRAFNYLLQQNAIKMCVKKFW